MNFISAEAFINFRPALPSVFILFLSGHNRCSKSNYDRTGLDDNLDQQDGKAVEKRFFFYFKIG